MPLQAGTRLGPYEILGPIGAGGMGEVYRARDTRLDRAVAIKVLSPQLAHSQESHQRFEREARTISALDHPHICPLYDVGRQDGTVFLVMQYLEGETLAARLARGALRLPEALNVAIQIAEAIDAMHQHGIVHRDLKPGNIMLTASGVKLLDFGLAKLQSAPVSVADATASMTQESPLTSQGSIVGTVQYMSPEQLQGKGADARSDHWAFGCILYEMTSGRRPFEATTPASLVAKILETSPPALSAAAPLTPPALDHVVQVCLAKDPMERWQSAHDLLLELRWVRQHASTPGGVAVRTSSGVSRREWLAWGGAVVALLVAAISLLVRRPEPTPPPMSRTELLLPARLSLQDWGDGPVISPDGRTVAFTGVTEGTRRLYVRPVNASVIRPLSGTEGAMGPFWSSDGRAIGFSVDDQIRRVDVTGGAVVTLGEYEGGFFRTATWNGEGVVLFDGGGDRLIRRMGERGTTTAVTRLDASHKERSHSSPQFLPDGQHFLYFAAAPAPALYVGSLGSTNVTRVADVASPARYAAGHLLYVRQRTLMARPFDPVPLEFRGAEIPLADGVVSERFSASQNGTIAYRPAESDFMSLVWFDRHGSRRGTLGEPAEYRQVVLSPSGARVAVARGDPGSADLWLAEAAKGVFSRLTRGPGRESDPAWSPDERYLAYSKTDVSLGGHEVGLAVVRKDLVTGTDQAVAGAAGMYLDDWTADGRSLICRRDGSVFAIPASGASAAGALLQADIDETHVSPDGHWVAYNSDESGAWEVYVAGFPDFARKRQVSVAGGLQPHWRRDGRELFYMTPDGLVMSVAIRTVPELATETPTTLFATNLVPTPGWSQYGVSPDGQRFLVMESSRQFFTLLQHRLSARAESQ